MLDNCDYEASLFRIFSSNRWNIILKYFIFMLVKVITVFLNYLSRYLLESKLEILRRKISLSGYSKKFISS